MAEEEKKFTPIETQEALDAAITERLEAARQEERGKFADYENLKTQLATANETNAAQSERIKTLETNVMKNRIAAEVGLPSVLASRLAGEDEGALRKDAVELLEQIKPKHKALPMRNPEADDKPSKDGALKRMLENLKNN